MNVPVYYRGQTIVVTAAVSGDDGAFDPDGGVTVDVIAPDATKPVDGEAMTKTAVGAYALDYTSEDDAPVGLYEYRVTIVDGSRVTITGGTFKLVA